MGARARVQRTDTCFRADGLEESGNILKRQAGVIMVLGQEVVWLEERFLVRLRINKGKIVGSRL